MENKLNLNYIQIKGMHLNSHTAYDRLDVNYFCKKLHHRCEVQNSGVILLIQSIICIYLL